MPKARKSARASRARSSPAKKLAGGGWFSSYFKAGFGLGLGSILALMLVMALAVGIFIAGFILVKKESKKPKDQQNTTRKVVGFVLMGLAMVIGLGFGAPVFFALLGEAL